MGEGSVGDPGEGRGGGSAVAGARPHHRRYASTGTEVSIATGPAVTSMSVTGHCCSSRAADRNQAPPLVALVDDAGHLDGHTDNPSGEGKPHGNRERLLESAELLIVAVGVDKKIL